ncbi:MAG: septal ring lytic transglycosylase RlpA family protein [Alphaproteobacteria bacterium]|nr:septal ring lytic transglycosylase RlpA family protein [Alphaproteobacteria bacterium]MBL0717707.1 septal ring lytic transglycosylase RlpA family protein [Alphaproteobacteria bacterium]
MNKGLLFLAIVILTGCAIKQDGTLDRTSSMNENNSEQFHENSDIFVDVDASKSAEVNTGIEIENSRPIEKDLLATNTKYVIGATYKVGDVEFSPAENYLYIENGTAGIIPKQLDQTRTANGETFDVKLFSVAHHTLPLPSIVKITNLDNNQIVLARVNDRGPFVTNRIVDVSPAVAKALKFDETETANIRIEIDEYRSKNLKNSITHSAGITNNAPVAIPAVVNDNDTIDNPFEDNSKAETGQFAIQAGAFYSHENASVLAQKLQSVGEFFIFEEGPLYKVKMTNVRTREEARNIIQQLQGLDINPGLTNNGEWESL